LTDNYINILSHKSLISINEYHVIKSGYDENRLTKQNHSTALLNTDRQGKLLNRTPTDKEHLYIIYQITPRNITWQQVQGWTNIMETTVKGTYFFINMELGHHLPVTQLVSFLQ